MGFIRPSFQAIMFFPAERAVILRERRSGAYRLSAYYLAKMASTLPVVYLHPFVFMCIAYPMMGFTRHFVNFILLLVITFLSVLTSDAMGIMVSTLTAPNVKRSTVVITIFILSMMLVGGLYVTYFPFWFAWIKFLSFFTFVFEALLINEFSGNFYYQNPNETSTWSIYLQNNSNYVPGSAVLVSRNVDVYNIGYNALIIIGYGLLFRILGYIFLYRSMKKAPV